ncbi:hypothetical protein ES702_02730 [subsurface metagenome]
MPALKVKSTKGRPASGGKEQVAFLITLALAIAFVVIGALKGSDLTYGVDTSSTCTTTVTATIKAVIAISCSDSVNFGDVTPGSPDWVAGDVTVTSNSIEGWKLYNYSGNYMTKTTTPYQSITDKPAGTPPDPHPWTAATTRGLGFSLSGPINDAVWHDGAGDYNYSSFTTTSGGAQLVNNYVTWSNQAENLTVLYVLDVATTQLSGTYRAEVSWFAVTHV